MAYAHVTLSTCPSTQSKISKESKALKSLNCALVHAFTTFTFSDMIAIPDFAAGAMENWGLITYRETALLYDPVASSESNKMRIASVVSHELAHQVKAVLS